VDNFDFPMIDNTRLTDDPAFAIVLKQLRFQAGERRHHSRLPFPGKYTGLREKPYYDEVLAHLFAENERTALAAAELRATPGPP
jgi:hypothetical protein